MAKPTKKRTSPAPARAAKAAPKGNKSGAAARTRPAVSPAPESAAAAPRSRGLAVFGAILGVIVVLAVVSKLRQGPPVKHLTPVVLATFTSGDNALNSPRGIAVDGSGGLYVADLGNNRIVKFNSQGAVESTWGGAGDTAGRFKEPSGVAAGATGEVYVADAWNGRIQKFTAQGEYQGEISAKSGNFYSPRNVAVDAQGYVYVADTGNSCVKKFDRDANLVKRWGEFGPGKNRFQETFGLWAGGDGKIYVGDAGNRKIKIFTSDGQYISEIRVKGWQTGNSWPMVAADAQGRIYATDPQNQMIWIYDAKGKYLGSYGNKPGREIFFSPLGITVDGQGAVYVCNMTRGEILKLAPFKP